jgi:hypothetical protein
MGWIGARRQLALRGLALAFLLLALAAAAAPGAQAERVLDPNLSLIGRCAEPEALDPVEDPGCPTTPPQGAHPPAPFAVPNGVATDFYGDIYVSNFGKSTNGRQGRIDIFTPAGRFISELAVVAPLAIAVDSQGNLYVRVEVGPEISGSGPSTTELLRFDPSVYEPEAGKIEYGNPTALLVQPGTAAASFYTGIAIDNENDHLFANYGAAGVVEYDSATAGNAVLRTTPMPTYPYGMGVAVDAAHHLLYAVAADERVDIFDLTKLVGPPSEESYEKVGSIEGSAVPQGNFGGYLSVAVDESTGNIFVLDGKLNVAYQFAADGTYLETIEHGFNSPFGAEIGVDNGPFSPNGGLNDTGHYLYVPSGKTGVGHSYAFEESSARAPEVKSANATGITLTEAELQASVDPGNLETTYTFEYESEERFEAEGGFNGATIARSGQLPAGNLPEEAAAPLTGLQAGTQYRFRIVVTNEEGSDEMEGSFATYPAFGVDSAPCGNQLFRTGPSALLSDCRAYELVTPADTNGRAPVGAGQEGGFFTTHQVAPDGGKVPFRVEGGTLPGIGGTGSYLGDPFVSTRGADGWGTAYTGPNGSEAVAITPGGSSPDIGYSFWTAESEGSALFEGRSTSYLRFPDGHSEILGKGSIGTDPEAAGLLISENGTHVLFGTGYLASADTAVQIEPDAAPSGTQAIYDRTADGVVHVVSLLPGDQPLGANEGAIYQTASLDGEGIVFAVGNKLYFRHQDQETFELGENAEAAGVSEGGRFAFYRKAGRLWRFDAETGERLPFSTGEVTPVVVSADGSTAYFVSTSKLSSEPNPNGAFPQTGQQNLYVSREGEVRFVGTVTVRDVEGIYNGARQVDGLGLWLSAISNSPHGRFGLDPARATSDGSVLLFQSRAPLAGYDPEGHSEVYRYDSSQEGLQCLSCDPTGGPATGNATLQSENREGFALFLPSAWLENLNPNGTRAIFQSTDPLVPGDTDNRQDVYEWEADGVGSCATAGGCTFLISSGHSSRNEYLYAVSESGDDVFFISTDLLLPADENETPSIYDARVGGGFPEPAEAECQGEGCRPQLAPPPPLPAAQTPVQGEGDNFKPPRRCRKGQHKVKRGGKTRCVKKSHKKRHQRAGSNQKGGGK